MKKTHGSFDNLDKLLSFGFVKKNNLFSVAIQDK